MKKILSLLLTFAMLFTLTACAGKQPDTDIKNLQAEQPKLILGLDDSFPPMGFRNENNEIVGFDIDLAKAVCEELGMKLELKPIDWSTKELELNSGKIDCIWNGLTYKDELNKAFLLSKPYLANNQIIAVKSCSGITEKSQLVGKIIGVQTGSTAESALSNDGVLGSDKTTTKGYAENVTALQDLKLGRVDAVVLDEVVARYYTTQEPSVMVMDGSLVEEVYVVAFKKDNDELSKNFETAFKAILGNGKGAEISEKWFTKDVVLR